MKYNIKIKKISFFILVAIIFCLPVGKVSAVNVCGSAKVPPFGECQTLYCSSGFEKDMGDLTTCSENSFATLCCKPIPPVATDSMTSCADASGRKGNCEFGACSEGLDPTPIQSTDCWFGRNCCAPKVDTKPIASASSSSSLPANTGGSNSGTYQSPSLIKCGQGDAGLCYNRSSGGCPLNVFETADVNNKCGTSYICCLADTSRGCGARDGVCVDEETICTNEDKTNKGDCETGEKCCLGKIPYDEKKNENEMTVATNVPVAYDSQCNSSNQKCTHDNDPAILTNQCKNLLATSNCSTMPAYLDALADQCVRIKAPGFDCNLISSNGFYGNEAKRFADYFIQNMSEKTTDKDSSSTTTSQGAGGLDFDTIAAMGLPDSPGVKSVLVNVVKWLLGLISIITLIAFIISGGQYLMASGDDKMIETAKKNMTYSVIGIIVALSGFVIIRAIDTALRATSSMF